MIQKITNKIKTSIKQVLPEQTFLTYHYCLAWLAALVYAFPSRKMHVIAVTGTKGKTSAINFLWSTLTAGGHKTGIISTANIRIGDTETLNYYHMTMPGRFAIQKTMAKMLAAGCTHCIIETTSEGIKHSRHIGIAYDCAIFTNLTPEHLPSHGGSFERYKSTKAELFRRLSTLPSKSLDNKTIGKIIIANLDDPNAQDFLAFPADRKITYGIKSANADFHATNIHESTDGVIFDCTERNSLQNAPVAQHTAHYTLSILGAFNIYNALPAIAFAKYIGLTDETIARGLTNLTLIPGRMEQIDAGQPFTVIVDYAHEKISMNYAMQTARAILDAKNNRLTGQDTKPNSSGKIIVSLGAEGGGRDKTKRKDMGEIVARMADYVIVSNVDPYEDDPAEIIEDIARAIEATQLSQSSTKKVRDVNLFTIADRREGIRKALSLAQPGDIVIIACKGAEQSMIIGGKTIPWDDRKVVREELDRLSIK